MVDKNSDSELYCKKYNCGIINRRRAKEYILNLCSKVKPQYTRVSPAFLKELEEAVETIIKEKVIFSESKKKTLK